MALEQFRSHYGDVSITKWDIFHYVYAVLHHPEYRERYAANLRRELPRIPFVGTSGAKAQVKNDTDAALKRRSSTAVSSSDVSSSDTNVALKRRSSTNAEVRGENSPKRPMNAKVNARSLDSAIGGASASNHSAQDDRVEVAGNDMLEAVHLQSDFDVFGAFVKAGQRLAEIHVHYEQQPEYPLSKKEKAGEKLDYRVEKMKLSKDKSTLIYNRFLTLSGILPETYEYRLGNRSALEWVIDQYQVSTDKRSGIVNDPNREDDPEYILRLIGQVVTVSLETVQIVKSLPPLGIDAAEA